MLEVMPAASDPMAMPLATTPIAAAMQQEGTEPDVEGRLSCSK